MKSRSLSDQIKTKIEKSFARQDMMRSLGASLHSIQTGRVIIAAPNLPQMRQQHGFAHAAVAFALGDSAAGYAALTLMDPGDEVLTAEMKINLLAPADGNRFEATGHVIRFGKRLIVVGATVVAIRDEGPREIAILQGTMVPVSG